MRALRSVVVLVLVAGVAFAAGILYGKQRGQNHAQAEWLDREISLKGVDLHKDLTTLLVLRQQPQQQVAQDLELWVVERIKSLDLESVSPGSASSAVLRETANRLSEYRAKFPASTIDPSKEGKVKRLLTFAGPSAFPSTLPSNSTVETDARKGGARGSP